MMSLSMTAIEQQKISLYPVFSDENEFSSFLPKQKTNPFHLVNKTTSESFEADISKLDTFSDATPIENICFTGFQNNKKIGDCKEDSSEKVNNDRIKLLAKKYAQTSFSKEDDARLAIVTEKIRQLMPRVTLDDFEQLAEIAGEINRINKIDNKLRNELGL